MDIYIKISASDEVTNLVAHRIFNTDFTYSCTHFVVEINKRNLALMADFNTV